LRQQQDAEYQEAMEADRRLRERKAQEAELKLKQELEEQQKKELEEAISLSEELAKQSALSRKRSALPDEPSDASDVAMVRFQLPQGAKVARRFRKSDQIQVTQKMELGTSTISTAAA